MKSPLPTRGRRLPRPIERESMTGITGTIIRKGSRGHAAWEGHLVLGHRDKPRCDANNNAEGGCEDDGAHSEQ
jgi:hypothetical protein